MNVLNYAGAAGLTALIVYLMIVGNTILLPLVIAVFVWYLINALAAVTGRITVRGTPLPAGVRLTGSLVVLVVLSWLLVNVVLGSVSQVSAAAPVYERNLQQLVTRASGWMGMEPPSVQALFQSLNVSGWIRRFAGGLTGLIGSVGTIAVYVAFLLLEQYSFSRKIAALFPDPGREALVNRIFHRIGEEIQTYVWLKTIMSLVTAGASYLVMKVVGVSFAEFWALLIFALNFIPYIGAFLGVIFPTALALVQFETLTPFVVTAAALTIVQFTTGSIIEPRIMGKGLNLSPLIMLLSLSVWGTIWGIVGMFLAVPMMVILMIVCSHFTATRPLAIVMSAEGDLRL